VARTTADRRPIEYPLYEEAQEIEDGLWRIAVPLPFALRSANIYLISNGNGSWTLVDAGLGLPADEEALRAGLALAGVTLDQIAALILTHAHPDHVGLSGTIQEASGAPVYMLRGEDDHLFGVWNGRDGDRFEPLERMYIENGLPVEIAEAARAATLLTRKLLRLPHAETLRLVADGEELRIGAHSYQCLWTPGHSDYHLCLLREDRLFIAGDHILPSITPNIGLYPGARPDPLGDYYGALAKVRDTPARLVLPGHRLPFTALAERVDQLRLHHEERSARVRDLLRAHPTGAVAATLSAALFGERLRTNDDLRFALVETLAHLEYLRLRGLAERRMDGAHALYLSVD
jgi:glyoxylase-like metal-dependent hydrolase (beta-lactamase superfamily II)